MMAQAPQTQSWTARENKQPDDVCILVNGLVRVNSTSDRPRLKEAGGSGSKALVLDLTIEPGRESGQKIAVWMPAHYHTDVATDQYEGVDIRWEGKHLASCKVVDDKQYEMRLGALTQAANKSAGTKSVGGWAKGKTAKKKTAKKAASKKRTARKSAGKKKAVKKTTARKRPVRKSAVKRSGVKKRSSGAKRSAGAKRGSGAKRRPVAKKKSGAKRRPVGRGRR
jgi:hypothetical protein